MKNVEHISAALLVGLSLTGFSVFAYVATTRPLTDLESVFLQFFSVATGFLGTFMVGRLSAKSAAADVIKPHARSAFRRLLSLYGSLHRMATIIAESGRPSQIEDYRETLAKLEVIAIEQISAADDALADWRDIVPEDVEELYKSATRASRERQ